MKKIIYFLLWNLIIFFIINFWNPLISNATTTAKVYLKTDKNIIQKGEEIQLIYYIEAQKTAAYNINLYFDETKLEFISGAEKTNIEGNRIIEVWYDEQGGNGAKEGELGKITFKAKEDGIANFVIEGEFYTEKGQLIQANFESTQVQIGEEETYLEKQAKQEQGTNTQTNNAKLQTLRINLEGMTPEFKSDINEYDITITNDINNLEILAVAENQNSEVNITGNNRLKRRVKYYKNNGYFRRQNKQ